VYRDLIGILHVEKSRIVVGGGRKVVCNEIFGNEQFIS
jgi:hypothetical protein